MPKIIHSIEIEDFRSFDKKSVDLESVTCLVGANESGKTNLLDAINLAQIGDISNPEDKRILRVSDIRKNSARYPANQLPTIKYKLSTDLIKKEQLKLILDENKIKEIILIREANELKIQILSLNIKEKLFKNISGSQIILKQLTSTDKTQVAIKSENEKTIVTETNNSTKSTESEIMIEPNSSIRISAEVEKKFNTSIQDSLKAGTAQLFGADVIEKQFMEDILNEIKNNIKLFYWSYDKKYSLPDIIPIQEIKTNYQNLPVVKAIFKLGDYDEKQVQGLFAKRSEIDYENIFDTLSDMVTDKINKKWKTKTKIKIQIRYNPDHLLVSIKEPGYSIEPKYRSEGMRWFLAFIIGMISYADQLIDYVILIDEPALHLHPGGQKDVLNEINKIADENQIVYSTHSPFMIDRRYQDRVRFLMKTIKNKYALTGINIPTHKDIFRDPLLRLSLGYSLSDVSYINEENILVEGLFDKKIIEAITLWLAKFSRGQDKIEIINTNNTSVINCDGASEIINHAKLYKNSGLICLSFYDSDQSGKSALSKNSEQTKDEKIEINNIIKTKDATTEDLIPESVITKALGLWSIKLSNVDIKKIKLPRMKYIYQILGQHLKNKKLEDQIYSEARMVLKHELEENIVKQLEMYLIDKKPDLPELKTLLDLNNLLVKKINFLIQKASENTDTQNETK